MNSKLISFKRCIHCSTPKQHILRVYYNRNKDVTDPARQDPDYFEKWAAKVPLDEHYLDTLKKIWEEKIGSERDLKRKGEDNLIGNSTDYGLPPVDSKQPRLEYREVEALRDAPETVKKIFSVEFGERSDLVETWKRELIDAVNLHEYDKSSLQSKIAWATVCIRHWSLLYDEVVTRNPKKRRPRQILRRISTMLNLRREWIQSLRDQDYEEFEKVLKKLHIAYQLPKEPEHLHTRKAWTEFQLKKRINAIKEERLHNLQLELETNREERSKLIDSEIEGLNAEEADIEQKLKEIDILEGKSVENLQGKYQPKLIEELSEHSMHQKLFYFPKPDRAAQ